MLLVGTCISIWMYLVITYDEIAILNFILIILFGIYVITIIEQDFNKKL